MNKGKIIILKNKNAVIYGASPSLGGAIAKAFADAGANVYVTHERIEVAQQDAFGPACNASEGFGIWQP